MVKENKVYLLQKKYATIYSCEAKKQKRIFEVQILIHSRSARIVEQNNESVFLYLDTTCSVRFKNLSHIQCFRLEFFL